MPHRRRRLEWKKILFYFYGRDIQNWNVKMEKKDTILEQTQDTKRLKFEL